MNKEKLEKWLKKQIKMKKDAKIVLNKNCSFENLSVLACPDKEIHISGIREIADILGLDVIASNWNLKDSGYNFEIYFMYNGYKFFDLEE